MSVSVAALLGWLEAWPGARWLQDSGTAYLFVNAAHLLGIALLLGSILPLDLRLVFAGANERLAILARSAVRVAATGLALAIATGAWLFSVQPLAYLGNAAFRWKLVLLALALANIAAQHRLLRRRPWPRNPGDVPAGMRMLAGLSALLWTATLVAGRWIGFV
ncbi:DUF2214 domain-containing protein [Luteimonas sp. SJ-92]|uniref:DUF2214 domain-containing protein n=1 Tax=Luteimonas salinisoli TaxID=2752307 RepID=A0A853JE66_9GAMM|nr:DUF6644 family protein [Luteimonas salinisoli]NZA27145.1 DUF2214 domain-containing protein [Luteimonas salinisoli]